MTELFTPIDRCLLCGSTALAPVLDLGDVPLPTFPKPGEDIQYAPLALQRCVDCDLVMLTRAVDKRVLYGHYYYRSGLNEAMVRALDRVVRDAVDMVDLQPGDVVLDIGANDGTLLAQYPDLRGLTRIGFDPSDVPLAGSPNHHGSTWLFREYFPPKSHWLHYAPKRPKIITACAMFYDLLDPTGFLLTVREWLADDGVFVVQMPDLRTMLTRTMVDNICHEHVAYWPNHTLIHAARECGFRCHQIEHNDVNGGSLRYTFRKAEPRTPDCHHERIYVHDFNSQLERFADRSREYLALVAKWVRYVQSAPWPKQRKTWAYGASTKGVTLLAAAGLGPEDIEAIADRNPEKWGRELPTPKGGIPIVSEEEWRRDNPPYTLVLPWGFLEAFKERERYYLEAGGHFIVPLPVPKVIGGEQNACDQPAHAPAATGHGVSP